MTSSALNISRGPKFAKGSRPTTIDHTFARALTHALAQCRIDNQLANSTSEIIHVVRFCDEPVLVVLDQFLGTTRVGNNYRNAQACASIMTLPNVSVVLGNTKISADA